MSTRSSTDAQREKDEWWMDWALGRAVEGLALAHPNPRVGAVVVKNGRVVGDGFHAYDRRDHAEIVALQAAGNKARGATLYVSLEPCCTTGRTGPCARAIIGAGVKRVVAAMRDPNPAVSGRGLAQLRRAGILVTEGIREEEARHWNEDFACWILEKRPFVMMKVALTLDGQIASRKGSTTRVTSRESHTNVQWIRHRADALLTGIGTVLADDPRLTDRTGQPRRRPLLRAVVDSHLRMPSRSRLVRDAQGDLVIFTAQSPGSSKARTLIRAGAEVFQVPSRRGRVDLGAVIRELGRREMLNILIEGGAELNGAALEAGIVDKMYLFYAPRVMGTGGVPMARIPSQWFAKAPALGNLRLHTSGPDFCVIGYFHDVYGDHRARRKN